MRRISKIGIWYVSIIILVMLLVLYIFRCRTIFDEDYTLELVQHSFVNIINLDSVDVHPPLYYFFLKIFLIITTFWSKSLLIKVIFARVFSICISFITFIFLYKLLQNLFRNYHTNVLFQLYVFLVIPGVISLTCELIKIRMYSLGAMFVVIEFYEVILYINYHFRLKYLNIAVIMACLSLYTNYYSGVISGFIFIYFLLYCLIYKHKHYKYFVWSIIIMTIAFLPWIPIFINQIKYKSYHSLNGFFDQWVATLLLILIFVYPLLWSLRHLNDNINIAFFGSFFILVILFVLMTVVSMIYKSVFQFRYVYFIFIIYYFIGINVLLIMIKNNNYFIIRIGSIILLMIIIISSLGSYCIQIKNNFIPTIQTIEEIHRWSENSTRVVNINKTNKINDPDSGYEIEEVMCLSTDNKYAKFNISNAHRLPSSVNNIFYNPSYNKLFQHINSHIIN